MNMRKKDLLCEFGEVVVDDYECEDFEKSSTPARIIEETDKEHEQLAEWLEELKELREYKKKMKAQFLDDIENPLEPIKLSSALESEIFKYEYRAEHDPQKISPLDYTIIYALKHCLEEQLKEVE